MTTQTTTLRTGIEVHDALVRTVNITLGRLMDTDPIAFYEAVMVARDSSHVPFGNTSQSLRKMHLLESDGRMHDATRDVILASVDGQDFDLHLVSPYAEEAAS